MNKIKNFLCILALPWIYLFGFLCMGASMFRDNGGHTSGLGAGLLLIGAMFAAVVGVIEIGVLTLILFAIFH